MRFLERIDRAEAQSLRLEYGIGGGDVEFREFDGALAHASPAYPNSLFNRVVGLGDRHAGLVGEFVDWFGAQGIPARLDTCPGRRGEALTAALEAAGLESGGFPFFSRRVMAGAPRPEPVPGVDVALLRPEELDLFHEIVIGTWPMPPSERARRRRALDEADGNENIRHYIARFDGAPAAAATLFLVEEAAVLGLAATREEFRGRGAHTALIQQRLVDTVEAGRELVTSLVSPDSGSQRNLQRAGLEVICDRDTWLPPDWTDHPFYRETA